MVNTSSLLAGLVAVSAAEAHYIFSILTHNGKQVGTDYTYIRKNTNTYMPSYTSEVVNSPDLRCNKGATNAASQTYTVKAGDTVGAKIWNRETIEHPGPAFVYMSKAPGSVSSYDGSGDWFKVWESGPTCGGGPGTDTAWCTWQDTEMSFKIPANIPSGEWLVRFEHIAIHEGHVGKAQFYMECAQLKIEGGSTGGTGSPAVKIPGVYKSTDPGIALNKWNNPTSYTMPGGPIATFGGSGAGAVSNVAVPGGNVTTPETPAPVVEEPAEDAAGSVALWKQCGGSGYTGPTACAEGSCKGIGGWFSICMP
ncbi:hypothetical protein OHC33_003320 [Knufia fluminis]|uniref:AA9 family lytic polysaccharide monooxygenase n=1 Tax=Knufia fluminis TaxID=191047 RepID=A0AAN8EH49_9EURO|nr:hypothetical protein OHC33_003320 [Knufia fluminis]